MEVRQNEADYIFCKAWGYPNVASYMASYDLKGKEFRAKCDKWLSDNGYKVLKYNKLSTEGDWLFEKIADAKEWFETPRTTLECPIKEHIIKRLVKKGHIVEGTWTYRWKSTKTIQTITEELL